MNEYGNVLSLNKEYTKADSLLNKSYLILKDLLGASDPKTVFALKRLNEHKNCTSKKLIYQPSQ